MNASPFLHFRQAGQCITISHADFWNIAASYEPAIRQSMLPGGVALVLARTTPDAMALFAAIIASGRVAAWFPPNAPRQDRASYLAHQRAAIARAAPSALFITDPALATAIAEIDPALAAITSTPTPQTPCAGDSCRRGFLEAAASSRTIVIQHSSGTTGLKKPLTITGTMLSAQYQAYWPTVRQIAGEHGIRIASWLPLYHDMGLMAGFLLPLLGGNTISMIDPFEWIAHPETLFDMIEQDACSLCWMPNFAFRHLIRLKKSFTPRRLGTLRAWINCSESCRLAEAADYETTFAGWGVAEGSVVGCYAMAETTFAITQGMPGAGRRALRVPQDLAVGQAVDATAGPRAILSSGAPLPGVALRILDGGTILPNGHYGEIAVRAPGENAFLRTGDLGALVGHNLFVLGRSKEIIIVNGRNLFAGDIESCLSETPGCKPGRVAAFGIDNPRTGSESLIIVAESDGTTQSDTLRTAITRTITETFMIQPTDVRVVAERWLVKSTSGKISRAENRAKYTEQFG